MEKIMKYSVLRYCPSKTAGESINLGIIFDSESEDYHEFRYTKKFSRLMHFDDELDISEVKKLLKGIEEDVNGSLLSRGAFDLEKYIKYFINNFSFDKPKKIAYDSLEEVVSSVHKAYFRFDYEKRERPSVNDDKRLVLRMLTDAGKDAKRDKTVLGEFQDKITYDIVTEDYNIKIFDFDHKDLNRLVSNAKTWAWNAKHGNGKELVIIYRYSQDTPRQDKKELNTITGILKESGAIVLDFENGITMLQS